MKVRSGFVSNSSTTSFALIGKVISLEEIQEFNDGSLICLMLEAGDGDTYVIEIPQDHMEGLMSSIPILKKLEENDILSHVFRTYLMSYEGYPVDIPDNTPLGCVLTGGVCSINGPSFTEYNYDKEKYVPIKDKEYFKKWLEEEYSYILNEEDKDE